MKYGYLIAALLVSMSSSIAHANEPLICFDGNQLPENEAFIDENDRTQIPIRMASEAFGFKVDWNGDSREVTVKKDDDIVKITIDSDVIYKNGTAIFMDTDARLVNDTAYIPLRFLMEALDCTVDYDDATGIINITNEKQGYTEHTYVGENTNPRGLYPGDFHPTSPDPLTDLWYTVDEIPEELTKALSQPIAYEGRYSNTDDISTDGHTDTYDLSNGPYQMKFNMIYGDPSMYLITDKEFKSSTGRIAVLLDTPIVKSDDLYVNLALDTFKWDGDHRSDWPVEFWHKVYDGKVAVVFDELSTDEYYHLEISNISDETKNINIEGSVTIVEY